MIGSKGVMSTTPETEHIPATILPAVEKENWLIESNFNYFSERSKKDLKAGLKVMGMIEREQESVPPPPPHQKTHSRNGKFRT